MNPVLQEILHNITSRLATLEQAAQSDKLVIDLIKAQRDEIDRLRAAQPEHYSDCAVYNEPAYPKGKCNCGRYKPELVLCECGDGITPNSGAMCGICASIKPKREWIGLTDDEIAEIAAVSALKTPDDIYFARLIEAMLKEKNA